MSPLFRFYLSCFFAFLCGHTVNYSVIIYAQDIIGSDLLSGIGFGLCFGPPILLGWYAGVLCDRLAPNRIIVISQLLFIVAALILLVAHLWVTIPANRAIPLIVSAFLVGCAWSFIAPARMAALGQLASVQKLHSAMVLLNLLIMLGFGLAPVVIAGLEQTWGWEAVFLFIAAGFAAATLLLTGVPSQGSDRPRKSVIKEIHEGLQAVTSKPILFQFLLTSILAYTLMGPMQVLLPKLASSQLMLFGLDRGFYLGTLALALIIGGLLCMALKARLPDGWIILTGTAIAGIGIALLSQIVHPLASAGILLLSGIVGGMVVSLIVAGLQTEAASEVRGRVMGMYTMTSQIIPAASGFFAGALSEYLGVADALLICGLLIALTSLIATNRLRIVRAFAHD